MAMVLEVTVEEDGKYVVHLGPRTLQALISQYKEGLNINEVLQSFYINMASPSFEKILKWDLVNDDEEVSFFLGLLKRYAFDKEIGNRLVKGIKQETIRLSDIHMSFDPLMDDGSLKYDMMTGDKDGADSVTTRFDKEPDPHRNKVRPVIPGIQPTDGDIKDKSYVELQDSWKG